MEQLLFDLKMRGIRLGLDGDELRVSAPRGALTDELKEALRANKDQLRDLLQRSGANDEAPPPALEADRKNRFEPFPLTDLQHAYWVGRNGSLEMGNVATHFYVEFDCPQLDLERLNDALCRMIDCHDMLRAIVGSDGMQRVLPEVPRYRIAVNDQSAASPHMAEHAVEETRAALSHEVRKPDQWPLFEVRATAMPGSRVRLHVSLDLLALDATSIFFFFRDWRQLYDHQETMLPDFGIAFRDHVLREQELRQSETWRRTET